MGKINRKTHVHMLDTKPSCKGEKEHLTSTHQNLQALLLVPVVQDVELSSKMGNRM